MPAHNPLPPDRWIITGFTCEAHPYRHTVVDSAAAHPIPVEGMEATAVYTFANRPPLRVGGIGATTRAAVECAMHQAAEEGIE